MLAEGRLEWYNVEGAINFDPRSECGPGAPYIRTEIRFQLLRWTTATRLFLAAAAAARLLDADKEIEEFLSLAAENWRLVIHPIIIWQPPQRRQFVSAWAAARREPRGGVEEVGDEVGCGGRVDAEVEFGCRVYVEKLRPLKAMGLSEAPCRAREAWTRQTPSELPRFWFVVPVEGREVLG